jgi:CBS domain-containing protein
MTLGQLFTKKVVIAAPTDSISDVAAAMARRHVGAVVIIDNEALVGIVTDRDVALALGARGISRKDPIRQIMSSPVATISENEGILAATRLMRNEVTRRLPIVSEAGRVVGLVSVDDLFVLLGIELGNLTEAIAPEVEAANAKRTPLAAGTAV